MWMLLLQCVVSVAFSVSIDCGIFSRITTLFLPSFMKKRKRRIEVKRRERTKYCVLFSFLCSRDFLIEEKKVKIGKIISTSIAITCLTPSLPILGGKNLEANLLIHHFTLFSILFLKCREHKRKNK